MYNGLSRMKSDEIFSDNDISDEFSLSEYNGHIYEELAFKGFLLSNINENEEVIMANGKGIASIKFYPDTTNPQFELYIYPCCSHYFREAGIDLSGGVTQICSYRELPYNKADELYIRNLLDGEEYDRMNAVDNGYFFTDDESEMVRQRIAYNGYGLDVLIADNSINVRKEAVKSAFIYSSNADIKKKAINDPSPEVRECIPMYCGRFDDEYLETLSKDPNERVRSEVAASGYCLGILANDPSPLVREVVASKSSDITVLSLLARDEAPCVRQAVIFNPVQKKNTFISIGLKELANDEDENIRKSARDLIKEKSSVILNEMYGIYTRNCESNACTVESFDKFLETTAKDTNFLNKYINDKNIAFLKENTSFFSNSGKPKSIDR